MGMEIPTVSPWIFGRPSKDAAWLILPGFLAIAAGWVLGGNGRSDIASSTWIAIYAFVALGFLDSGHVYATLWRTYFHRPERQRSSIYFYLPPLLFAGFFAWIYGGIPYLGRLVIYSTLYHNIRQFYGISKWYQKQNRRFDRLSDFFLYFLCLAPVIVAHFRLDTPWISYYTDHDVLFAPSKSLYDIGLIIYGAGLLVWFIFETERLRRYREWNRMLSLAVPAVIYGSCFLLGRYWLEILLPLVVAHGAAYLGLTSLAVSRTKERFDFRKAAFYIILTALFFGTLEFDFDRGLPGSPDILTSALLAFYLMALFSHYTFDAYLWKRSHPEAVAVYSQP